MTPAASAAAMAVQGAPSVVLPGLHRFELPIRTEQQLADYVACAFGIRIPDRQVCPNHSTPWRALCDAFFSRHEVMIWEASRGFGGKSQTLSLLGLLLGILRAADTNILGGSGEQSERVLEHMGTLMTCRNAPRHVLDGEVARELRRKWPAAPVMVVSGYIDEVVKKQLSLLGGPFEYYPKPGTDIAAAVKRHLTP